MRVLRNPHTTWTLANLAGCSSPDAHDGIGFDIPYLPVEGVKPSPGAEFLRSVEVAVCELLADDTYDEDDSPHEIADAAVPVYTHELWTTFVDLGAYNEDPSELGADSDDMSKAAAVCLYLIAERLARALGDEIEDDDDDDDEEG